MSNYEKNDNTRVTKLVKRPQFKRTISSEEKEQMKQQGYFWDGERWVFMGTISQGEGSPDNKTLQEKSKNYWDSMKGAKERVKATMKNETNPYFGIKRTILPAASGALGVQAISGIPILLRSAMINPHGISNLLTNMVIQTGIGTSGSYIGETIDKNLGGTGEIGSFAEVQEHYGELIKKFLL